MDIDDILKQERFNELDRFLTQEMHRLAGGSLVSRMNNVLGSEDRARNWFYSSIVSLGSKRPYDYCKAGDVTEVENLLGRIEYGVF